MLLQTCRVNLVEEASAFGGAGVFVVVVFGLFTHFGGVYSAAAALTSGVSTWIIKQHIVIAQIPYLLSLLLALTSNVLVACLGVKQEQARFNRSS